MLRTQHTKSPAVELVAGSLGTILFESGKVSSDVLAAALQEQESSHELLGAILLRSGHVEDADLAQALAYQAGLPFLPLDDEFELSREDIALLPERIARRFNVLPCRDESDADCMHLIMGDPMDIDAVDAVRSVTDRDVLKIVAPESRIKRFIDRFYNEAAYVEQHIQEVLETDIDDEAMFSTSAEQDDLGEGGLEEMANEAPVVRYVNLILMEAARDGASDIHFEPGEQKVRVRLRIDGDLRETVPPPRSLYMAVVTRIKILSSLDIAEKRVPQDGRLKFRYNGRVIDVRVSTMPLVFGEKIVMRLLDRTSLKTDLREIGLDLGLVERFETVLDSPNGIVLVTGPTGSGKTTTLYSALTYMRSVEKNIQTCEDPVEYFLDGINQLQTKTEIGLDFSRALRAFLRQDPDIIMVGEIRDLETAEIAMRASLTGHLVLSTLHTNDATSVIARLVDMGIPSYMIAATLRVILAQRLIRTNCPSCNRPIAAVDAGYEPILGVCPDAAGWDFHAGAGCENCNQTGSKGRTAIVEYLEMKTVIREMVSNGASEIDLRKAAIESGMVSLLMDGLRNVALGKATVKDVLSVCPLEDVV